MALYTYRAVNKEGRIICGHRNMPSSENSTNELRRYLIKKGFLECNIFLSNTTFSAKAYKFVSPMELSILCRQIMAFSESQDELAEGVQLLSETTDNRQLKLALKEIYKFMLKGMSFAESIGMYGHIFTNYMLGMISIGETTDTVEDVLLNLSKYFEKEGKFRRKIKSAVTYPVILTITMSFVVVMIIYKILPMFEDITISLGGQIPDSTMAVLSSVKFINIVILGFTLVVALVIAFVSILSYKLNPRKKMAMFIDKMKMKTPVIKYLYIRMIASRFARGLSILVRHGVDPDNAIDIIRPLINNGYLDTLFSEAIRQVEHGKSLDIALNNLKIFPPLLIRMLFIGHSGHNGYKGYKGHKKEHLSGLLEKSADVFDEELEKGIEKLIAIIEPMLIIFLSVAVGIILISTVIPMVSIINAI